MKFSDRIGATQPRETLQIESMDDDLTNMLWNVIIEHKLKVTRSDLTYYRSEYLSIWTNFYKKAGDTLRSYDEQCREDIKELFYIAEWHDRYNLVEHICKYPDSGVEIIEDFKAVLAQEKAGYRFIDGVLVPITDKTEIEAIQASSSLPDKYSGARQHIKNATEAFSQKPSPDYAQVIKESISGVESIAKVITGNKKATLGEALNELDKIKSMHGGMKEAFKSLYGYTSGTNGIRHALLTDEEKNSEADAHFMLVVCSAFINFAVAHYQTD